MKAFQTYDFMIRDWAMPNKWTFLILPIKKLIREEIVYDQIWIDPFAGKYSPASITNDIDPLMPTTYHEDALGFLKRQPDNYYDGVLFDPPYSPRQLSEVYKRVGIKCNTETTQSSFWSNTKDEVARIVKPNGKVLCCGWNSVGIGKTRHFELKRLLLVCHGGNHNDTIVTVEVKN